LFEIVAAALQQKMMCSEWGLVEGCEMLSVWLGVEVPSALAGTLVGMGAVALLAGRGNHRLQWVVPRWALCVPWLAC